MKLGKLLEGIDIIKFNCDLDLDIKTIKIDSREVEDGDVFLCLKGTNFDGNNYIREIDCNFVAITYNQPEDESVLYVLVEDTRKAYSIMSQNYFSRPLDNLKFIAVVGTNGKTSTAHFINYFLLSTGIKTGLIGTDGHFVGNEKLGESLTTPDPFELNELFFNMRAKGVEVVIAEVSAHAIFLNKLYGIKADLAVFTNLSQDHLDFFSTYEEYCEVKKSYFCKDNIKKAVINIDDKCGQEIAIRLEKANIDYITYGLNNPADNFAIKQQEGLVGVNFVANLHDEIVNIKSNLYGEFNVYNLLATLVVSKELGLSVEQLILASNRLKGVKGRFSVLKNKMGTIIIDYAHTPDGLKNLLSTARMLTKSRLITLFGCGGDRDTSKRKIMGEIASQYSDIVVLTSDNPRYEEPEKIISDIEEGISCEYKSVCDRASAIYYAFTQMLEGDTLVIAGKGNESYLDIKGEKIYYNDFDIVKKWGCK